MDRLQELFSELKRRRVFRALGGWGILSFAVLQVYEPIMHGLHLPEWTLTLVVLGLAAGFPTTVVLAWIFDLGPGGIERTAAARDERGAPAHGAGHRLRLAALLVGLGLLAAAPGLWWYLARRPAAAPAIPSVAVLPFVDMSPGKDQEFLGDGIAEEILDGLAQVKALHVTGRTSSFSFRGKGEDLKTIAAKLGVATLLEGSVRKEGGRVRVTAQLINATDGYHLWSQTFDRELTGVFAVEDEIARAVVEALRVRLASGQEPTNLARRTARPEAHEEYLLGNKFMDRGSSVIYPQARAAFERAIAADPGYAPAWAGLAMARFWIADAVAPTVAEHGAELDRAVEAADRAVTLGPDVAEGYEARGWLRCAYRLDWGGCRSDFERALLLNPGRATTYASYATNVASFGSLAEAVRLARRATDLDPLSARACGMLGNLLYGQGELAEARQVIRRCLEISPADAFARAHLAQVAIGENHPAEALEAVQSVREDWLRLTIQAIAQQQAGDRSASDRTLRELEERFSHDAAIQIAAVHAFRGEPDLAFRWLDRAVEQRDGGLGMVRWLPELKRLRDDPRYAALLQRIGLPPG